MQRRLALGFSLSLLAAAALPGAAHAQAGAPFKIGLILPMTGQQASTGKQEEAAVKLWVAQNGSTVAGRCRSGPPALAIIPRTVRVIAGPPQPTPETTCNVASSSSSPRSPPAH